MNSKENYVGLSITETKNNIEPQNGIVKNGKKKQKVKNYQKCHQKENHQKNHPVENHLEENQVDHQKENHQKENQVDHQKQNLADHLKENQKIKI